MKKYLLAIAMSIALPLASFAAATDVTLGAGSAILSVGGYSLTIVGTNAVVQSITVSASNFSAVLLPNSQIAVSSASGQVLSTDAAEANITGNQCSGGVSTLTLSASSGSAVTVTVTPSSSTCTGTATNSNSTTVSGNGSPGGGGGGGGGGYNFVTPTTAAPKTVTPTVTITPTATQPVSVTVSSVPQYVFAKPLQVGAVSADVKMLQKILNSDPDTRVAATGVGSAGRESTTLGPLTVKAIKKFQVKYKLAKAGEVGYGTFGPKTRAKLNEIARKGSVGTAPVAVPASQPAVNTADIAKQLSDSLKLLQALQEQLKALKK